MSAIEHGQKADNSLYPDVISAALRAARGIDDERLKLYLDLLNTSVHASNRKVLETTMNSLGFEYQSDFARRYIAEGKAEGLAQGLTEGIAKGMAKGRAEMILKLLMLRFGPLTETDQTRLLSMHDVQLDAVAERVLTAQTLDEALGPQSSTSQ